MNATNIFCAAALFFSGIASGRDFDLRVDGSTAASTHASVVAIERSMTDEEKVKFESALAYIRLSDPRSAHDNPYKGSDALTDDGLLGRRIDGLTVQQILKLGGE
jgi:hypothetical protein